MDCMLGMKEFPDKFFELAIVDPPYGIDIAKKPHHGRRATGIARHTKTGSFSTIKRSDYIPKQWDNKKPDETYFNELIRVSKNQIIWGINYFEIEAIGKGIIKWDKCMPEDMSFNKYEYAYCSFIDHEIKFIYMWAGMMQGESLKNPTKQIGNKKLNEQRIHPTQKPIKLYKWLLLNYAKPNDKILDTHLGSQSSRIAAYKLGFDFWGYELDEDYFKQGCERFEKSIAEPLFDAPKFEQGNFFTQKPQL